MEIKTYDFTIQGRNEVLDHPYGKDWPVVYLINNDKRLYIGETSSFYNRFVQHLEGKAKYGLKKIHAIFDDEFNKSAILDIEQLLIRLCGAENKYELLNANLGQSSSHNYYQREKYLNKVGGESEDDGIWSKLKEIGLVEQDYNCIINSNLFTYSPYTSLTLEQEEICFSVLDDILKGLEKGEDISAIVRGAAGTGKTILAIYLVFLIVNANKGEIDIYEEDNEEKSLKNTVLHKLKKYIKKNGELSIAYLVPMSSLRKTLQVVFKQTKNGLKRNMVIGPTDLKKKSYDIVVVDESHRLQAYRNISWMGTYKSAAEKLGFRPEECNVLDWVVKQSKCRVLFYDKEQTIKGSDITATEFEKSLENSKQEKYELTTQMRCKGGKEYLYYLQEIFNCEINIKEEFENYDIKLFDSATEMIETIKQLNSVQGLCRNVAGYSWKWKSKNRTKQEIEMLNLYDIQLEGKSYVWNMNNIEWILRGDSINEIGCVHTTQGYDLNYVGVIFGKEIDYDEKINSIIIDKEKFYDVNVKKGKSEEELKQLIINTYKVIMTRGIKGCYMYACNSGLKKYLSQFFEKK